MKKQVVVIHGGECFDNYEDYLNYLKNSEIKSLDQILEKKGWKIKLQERLGDEYETIFPRLPNSFNAKYVEWKIWFDKIVPLLNPEIILVGNSLGGIFLIKYLSENNSSKKIVGLHLVATPYDAEGTNDSLADFVLSNDLKNVENQATEIFFYQSKDDTSVPLLNVEKYRAVFPKAKILIFEDRGHFRQEEFPELVENIKNS